jgi:light-regulated signal transduction histidine kinase (bacteriophytochrome)
MMRQVIVNLVSNAVKLSSGRTEPRIEIGANGVSDTSRRFVRDNGVGFDMQYVDKLFGVFQRLRLDDLKARVSVWQTFNESSIGAAVESG